MTTTPVRSLPDICEVTTLAGDAAPPDAGADLVIELPHGATRASHFEALARELVGSYPEELEHFFFVNTDVGSPELGMRLAERLVAVVPALRVQVIRSLIPRTFIDCNRVIGAAIAAGSGITPGVPPYVRDERDRALLLDRHAAYSAVVDRAVDAVCAAGGTALMLHTYAPRTVGVQVDDRIVESLHAAYQADVVTTWPLRHEVDLITQDDAGRVLADAALIEHVRAGFATMGIEPAENVAYHLHPSTTAARLAARHPGRTLCLEVRRDLLVREFTPFAEMDVDARRVDAFAAVLEGALRARWADSQLTA